MWYLILTVIFVVWVCFDGHKRKANFLPWAIGAALLGPIVVPVYLAKRPLLSGEVREGGTAWNILKNFAILWTIIMAVAAVWGLASVGEHTAGLQSDAEKAGAAIGTVLGLGMIASVWFFPFIGAFILGFMLKKSSIVERGPVDQGTFQGTQSATIAKKPTRWLAWIGIIFLGLILIGFISKLLNTQSSTKRSVPRQEQASQPTTAQRQAGSQQPPDTEKAENWAYTDSPDKMGRGSIKSAFTSSVNTISFDFPYSGPQHGTLALRTHPQYGKDVILRIERGQFLTGIDGCKVRVRFDDGKPQSFWGNGPADHSTTTIFISDYSRFVASLKRAKKVMIEAPFFQEGNQVFEFNVEGLQWETAPSGRKK